MEGKTQGGNRAPKEENDIRVGMNSRVRNVITYCTFVLNEKKHRELHFSAVGGAIGKLVDVVEVLRTTVPGLFQVNKIATVSYQTVDTQGKVLNTKLYPKFEVLLTLDEPKEKGEGFQGKLSEEKREELSKILTARREERASGRETGRGRGRGFGRGRGRGFGTGRGRGFGGRGRGFGGRGRGFSSRGGSRGRGFGSRGGSRGGRGFRGSRGGRGRGF